MKPMTRWSRICTNLTLAILLVGGMQVACTSPAVVKPVLNGPGHHPARSHGAVDLLYVGSRETCVKVFPDMATIWHPDSANGPKRIRWWALKSDMQLHWEIEFAGEKEGALDDYLGTVDPIGCGQNHSASRQPGQLPKAGDATWPYEITVYGCENGVRSEEPLCKQDPMIVIKR